MMSAEVAKLLSTLDEDENRVIRLRFGLDAGDPRTQEDVGRELGVTRDRVDMIEERALAKLREEAEGSEARVLLSA
jgi:RNA polymerase primary sigma factor